ncbi:retrotransposon protein, putative, ty1-copia subclass [Tanacetum coccineum]
MCLISGHSLVDCPKAAPKRVVNGMDKGKGQTSVADDERFIEEKKKNHNVSTLGSGTFSLSNSFEALNVENPVIEEVETGDHGSDDEVEYVNNEMASYLDSNRQGWIWFDEVIKKFGFTQNRNEPSVYVKASGSNVTFLILDVDDILFMRNHISMLQDVKSYLEKCFALKDFEKAAYILGIKIYRDRLRQLIGLCQSYYIEKILKRDLIWRIPSVEMSQCKKIQDCEAHA